MLFAVISFAVLMWVCACMRERERKKERKKERESLGKLGIESLMWLCVKGVKERDTHFLCV